MIARKSLSCLSTRSSLLPVAARCLSSTPLTLKEQPNRHNPAAVSSSVTRKGGIVADTSDAQKDAASMGRAPTKSEVEEAKVGTRYANSMVGGDHEGEVFDVMAQDGVGEDVGAAGVVSGAPPDMMSRRVRIYRPSPTQQQSAKATSHHWRIDWDVPPGSYKFENHLMGWAASADYMQATHIKFKSRDDAIAFAERQGYPYFVQEPTEPRFRPKSYASNYLYNPGPLRIARTK